MSPSNPRREMLRLAQQYANGELEAECDTDLIQLFKCASDAGDPKVLYRLGMCYQYGQGIDIDLNAAVKYYVQTAELSNFEALGRLCNMRKEQSAKTDIYNAFRNFCEKADQGDAGAQLNAGSCYSCGIGTIRSKAMAGDLFLKAADQGCADAMCMLNSQQRRGFGNGYYGTSGISLLQFATEMGSAEAQYQLGCTYHYGITDYGLEVEQDHKQAAEWFQKAADQKHSRATRNLAVCYYLGNGVQKDVRKAFQLYKKAALMGDKGAYNITSEFYRHKMRELSEDEYPVDIDYFQAAYWNRKAIDQHNSKAKRIRIDILESIRLTQSQINELLNQTNFFESSKTWYRIARQYETGSGVEKDEPKAFQMYRLSARLGSIEGQVALARCYEQGIGTDQDIQHSMRWNIRAAMQGNTEATSALQKWLQQNGMQSSFKSQESMLTYAIITLTQLNPEQDPHLDILLCIIDPDGKYRTMQILDFFNKGQDPPDNAIMFEMCKLAIEQDIKAVYWMIIHSVHSKNIAEDFAGLPERLQEGIASGDAETVYCLARCQMLGLGTPNNKIEAINCYQFAVKKGHPAAQYELGYCYQEGIVVERSIWKAIELHKKAAEQQYIPALKILADIYESDDHEMQDLEQAFEYRKRAAELGDAGEQLRVAECYKDGIGVSQDDREALCWFQKAAHNGKYECYKYIAECYDNCIGTQIDQEAAFEIYRRLAIALPTKENLIRLAERLENGVGTQKDVTAAVKCYQQAGAHSKLGDIYYDGNYVDKNYETALNHYRMAKELNLVQLLNVIRIFTTCQYMQGDGLFYFKILKLTALVLRDEICKIEIIVW